MKEVKKENKKIRFELMPIALAAIFLGIFAGIYGINMIKNYYHPYLFGFISISLGLISGPLFVNYIKPYLSIDRHVFNQIGTLKILISIGFIGIILAIGSLTNKKLSKVTQCDRFSVVAKTIREDRFRAPGANFLHVDINGKVQKLNCSKSYWNRVMTGQKIELSIFESKIGFDFIELNEDK